MSNASQGRRGERLAWLGDPAQPVLAQRPLVNRQRAGELGGRQGGRAQVFVQLLETDGHVGRHADHCELDTLGNADVAEQHLARVKVEAVIEFGFRRLSVPR
jgi:hypothetical protein